MNFFKSVLADEPSSSEPPSDPDEPQNDNASNENDDAWSFGGLIKTLATKSESVIQNYRRELQDFGSELKKETAVIRDVASRAVQDLPTSLEVGATVAQESLESVGQAIDDIGTTVWKSTAEIITHGRDTLLAVDDDDDDDSDYALENSQDRNFNRSLDSKPYSRFEAQVRAVQSSTGTYLDEPEDLENYEQWKLGFLLDEKKEEIENLMNENGELGEIYRILVPEKVEHESFWLRYFYRVHKLEEAEDARVKLVKRAISGEEEDLSWDFDDEAENANEKEDKEKGDSSVEIADQATTSVSDNGENSEVSKFDEKEVVVVAEGKSSDSSDSSDVSLVSKPEVEEEDIGWDEIEDIGSNYETKAVDSVGSSSKGDLRKRLSNAAEEDEDLSWDIDDDDDEPTKP